MSGNGLGGARTTDAAQLFETGRLLQRDRKEMKLGICSYSFHRMLAAGEHDIFRYIGDCKTFGANQLDPWSGHLPLKSETIWRSGSGFGQLLPEDEAYLAQVKRAADNAGLPFGCLTVGDVTMYAPTREMRHSNRAVAYGWLEVARRLGVRQIRFEAGGPEDMPAGVFRVIVEGYRDLVARAQMGSGTSIEVLTENMPGALFSPANVVKVVEAVDGLGLLLDTYNWAPGMHETGWKICARYTRAVHVHTSVSDADTSAEILKALHILRQAGYNGCLVVESCPLDGDEYEGVRKAIELVKGCLYGHDW